MSVDVSMQFGRTGFGRSTSESSVIYNGTINDGTTVTLTLEPGGLYELFTAEFNNSTGAYRGHRQINIKAPEPILFGTIACAYGNAYASGNSGVTITYNADSSISIARSASTYDVIYVLVAVGVNIGNVSSTVSAAEAASIQAMTSASAAAESAAEAAEYAASASSSASSASVAVAHYPKITNGYWFVWNVNSSSWVDTGVKAQGEAGVTPDFSIGTVTTGEAGTSAAASITGTAENPVLNLTIPRGNPGGLILASNVSVAVSAWSLSATPISASFPYEASITINGVTTAMIPDVIFDVDDAMSGNFAPVSNSGANTVTIYAASIPDGTITIPTIMVHEV